MATPPAAWRTSDQREGAVPKANPSQPVRKTKIGVETLRRACEEGLIKVTRFANSQ